CHHTPLPVLHSFPTRRSSDLRSGQHSAHLLRIGNTAPTRSSSDPTLSVLFLLSPGRGRRRLPADRRVAHSDRRGLRGRTPVRGRSDEHTSELQSPYDLVCRLL